MPFEVVRVGGGVSHSPWSAAHSSASGGFESRPIRSTRCRGAGRTNPRDRPKAHTGDDGWGGPSEEPGCGWGVTRKR